MIKRGSPNSQAGYKWTNPSVMDFAQGVDPIRMVEKRAREIVLSALDNGWKGPPFDPFQLAEILKIPVAGNANIKEARLVPTSRNKVKIEFNPMRPKGRVRFSIAHEIAHTFFNDCYEGVKYRGEQNHSSQDDWQLELLCNIAASELLMPFGTLGDAADSELNINKLLQLRKEYDVSMEAILIRMAKLTNQNCNVFCASKKETGEHERRYQIDYIIPSKTSQTVVDRGAILPEDSIVSTCTAVGFTSTGTEVWSPAGEEHYIECVGLPPYPGSVSPRVAGIVLLGKKFQKETCRINYITGDVLTLEDRGNKIIAHVVNDKTPNWGGRGFAAHLKDTFPVVQKDFQSWKAIAGDAFSLGNIRSYSLDADTVVVSMIAQKGYGPSPTPRIRYSALEACLQKVAEIARQNQSVVHMPRIGSGYGQGEWGLIEELINDTLVKEGINVVVHSLPRTRRE